MPTDLLGPLGDEPVPPLTPAAVVRARGEQRSRRRRAALAGATALTLALAGGVGIALGVPAGTDALRPEPYATSGTGEDVLTAALLDPDDVGAVIGGRWDLRPTDDVPFDVVLTGCTGAATPAPRTALRFLDGPNGHAVGEHLALHLDEAAAQEAYVRALGALRACGESSPAYHVFEEGSALPQAYGQVVEGTSLRPFSLQRVGRAVVVVVEQGPMDASRALAEAAADEVRSALGGIAPPPTPEPATVTPQQLLDGPSVQAVLGGSWSTLPDLREDVYVSTYACPEGAPAARAGLSRGLESTDGQALGSQVLAFPDLATAAAVHAQLRTDVQRCPSRPEDSEDGRATASHELVPSLPGAGEDRFYLRTASRDCDDCPERAAVVAVARVGLWLVLVGGSPELEPELPRLADAAVARAGGTSAAPTAGPPARDWSLSDAFLPPEVAAEAELPGWKVVSRLDPADGPVADPCRDGSPPMSEAVTEVAARAMGSTREAGGSNLAQEVYRYDSPDSAAEAFAVHEQRYARCAEVPEQSGPDGQSVRSEVVARTADRLLVRRIPCMSGGCAAHFSTYEMVVRVGSAVTLVAYAISEDGDPAEEAHALAAAVERRLRDVVSG